MSSDFFSSYSYPWIVPTEPWLLSQLTLAGVRRARVLVERARGVVTFEVPRLLVAHARRSIERPTDIYYVFKPLAWWRCHLERYQFVDVINERWAP